VQNRKNDPKPEANFRREEFFGKEIVLQKNMVDSLRKPVKGNDEGTNTCRIRAKK